MSVKFSIDIPEGSKLIVLISMSSNLKDLKLNELIEVLKERRCDITILIADTLQKYNTDYVSALKMGDDFLQENKQILINVKVLRWHEYIESHKEEFEKNRYLVELKAKKGTTFYNKMVTTYSTCAMSKDLESSLEYQKEEYAAFLTMSEFTYHLYPKSISDGMAWLYKEFPDIRKPQYISVSFPSLQPRMSIFKTANEEKCDIALPIALQLTYEHIEAYLQTTEISELTKQLFKNKLDNLLILTDEETNQKRHKSTTKLVAVN